MIKEALKDSSSKISNMEIYKKKCFISLIKDAILDSIP